MKFSINTVLFVFPFTNANTNLFKNFKRWGYDAVEILVENPSDIDPSYVKRELKKCKLVCGSVCAAMNRERDLRGSLQSQRNGVKYLCQLLDQMVELDCPILGGPIYSYVGRADAVGWAEYRNQWKAVVRNLKVVAKYAEERGRLVCLEPLNRFETDFINTVDQGLKLIEDVGSPSLKLHLDTSTRISRRNFWETPSGVRADIWDTYTPAARIGEPPETTTPIGGILRQHSRRLNTKEIFLSKQ